MGRRVKRVVPGQLRATDRRTTRRHFLFSPDERGEVENAFWYCLATAAKKHGMDIHGAVLMSTHPHVVATDTRGVEPLFKADFHRNFAAFIKRFRGWPAEVFDKRKGGDHEPLTPLALVKALAYLIANPTAAFAVRYSKDWPGATTLVRDIGTRTVRARRPKHYFDPKNPDWPEEIELKLTMPPMLIEAYGEEGARKRIAERLHQLEREAWQEAKRRGIPFRGARRVTRTPHTVRANSYEDFGKIDPQFSSAGDKEAAAAKREEGRVFDAQYREALAQWTAGNRRAVFPYGTWWMRVHHHVRIRPAPT